MRMDDKTLEQHVAALEAVLQQQASAHAELLTLMQRQRQALQKGDSRSMAQLCALENEKVQLISELEKQRLELTAQLTLKVDPAADQPLRLGELAERLPEPARSRLLVLRQRLTQQAEQVRQAAGVARRAADALVRHMHGLIQTIGMLSTGVCTYSQRGALPSHATAVRTINLTA